MEDYSKASMLKFLDMITGKGWVNVNTGNAWKSAANKVFSDIASDEDVRQIDVKTAVLRYNNRFPGELTPESLRKYEQRAATAVEQFLLWKGDPKNYRPPGRGLPNANGKTELKRGIKPLSRPQAKVAPDEPQRPVTEQSPEVPRLPAPAVPTEGIAIPFPLRPTFLAQVVVPRDMTKEEAGRLCALIQALGQ